MGFLKWISRCSICRDSQQIYTNFSLQPTEVNIRDLLVITYNVFLSVYICYWGGVRATELYPHCRNSGYLLLFGTSYITDSIISVTAVLVPEIEAILSWNGWECLEKSNQRPGVFSDVPTFPLCNLFVYQKKRNKWIWYDVRINVHTISIRTNGGESLIVKYERIWLYWFIQAEAYYMFISRGSVFVD